MNTFDLAFLKDLRNYYHGDKEFSEVMVEMEVKDWQLILDTDQTLDPEQRANIEKIRDNWPVACEVYRIVNDELGLFSWEDDDEEPLGSLDDEDENDSSLDDEADDEWDPALDNEDEDQIGNEYHNPKKDF